MTSKTLLVSAKERYSDEGYLQITEESGPTFVKGKPFGLYEHHTIVGFYSSINSAKSAARRFYGAGIKWIEYKGVE